MVAPTLNDILVALARLEAKTDSLMEKLDRLEKATDNHVNRIADLEQKIAVLESQRGPRVHWVTILVGVIAVVGFGLAIFDRLYTNTTP
jgi:septal ring factor EnvC (AmiA/AmiB activator)